MIDLEQRIRKAQCQEIETMLLKRWEMMSRVLQNGRSIFEQSHGHSFDKLYEQRMKMWYKTNIYCEIAGAINKMY